MTRKSDFVRAMVARDVRNKKWGGRVATRFPPEPNGYMHIGHAKAVCLNFGLAEEFGGTCNLRFDDTNPLTEDMKYVDAFRKDVRWLGYDWDDREYFASDYFEQLYDFAVRLIEKGKAYVDSSTEDEIRERRGTVTEPGVNSPHRDRPVAENLDLFRRMRDGEFPDGAHVLRAKIDMAHPNMLMRDPLLYRIRHASHYRRGDAWCIYPLYDFTHCLSDAIERITHSLCSLEFKDNRALYDWIVGEVGFEEPPEQTEFARLNIDYTVLSKRKLIKLIADGHVSGWDDPRVPTIAGLRRRGVTPEAIRAFCDEVGVTRADSRVDIGKLEHAIREDLNQRAPRVMCVLRPLRLVIDNYPAGQVETLDAPYYPHDVPKAGSRAVPFCRELYIEQEDFAEDPPKGFHRLAPGREVRLRYAYYVRCTDVVKDAAGRVVEVQCTYDPQTKGGGAPDGRKVKGTLHWVSAEHAVRCEVRLYDRLFTQQDPDDVPDGQDFTASINPTSLVVLKDSRIEPSVAGDPPGSRYQFERQGYFVSDIVESSSEWLVFNRTVELRDSWAGKRPAGHRAVGAAQESLPKARLVRSEPPPVGPEKIIARDPELQRLLDAAVGAGADRVAASSLIVNEVQGELKQRGLDAAPFSGVALAELLDLLARQTVSSAQAKTVLAAMFDGEGEPSAIVERRGLTQVADPDALIPVVERVLAGHPDEVARFKAGQQRLLGFFVGQVMKASGGTANPKVVRELVRSSLS